MSSAALRAPGTRRATGLSWLAVPAFVYFIALAIVPLVGVLLLSFTDWDGLGAITFSGIGNWLSVLSDPDIGRSLWITFLVMALSWLIQTPLSLLLGVFTAGTQRYRALLAVLYFLPLLLSSAAIAVAFKALLDPNFGLAAGLNIPALAQDWLGHPTLAFGVVIFVIAWQFVPFHTLIYQGGVRQLQSVYGTGAPAHHKCDVLAVSHVTVWRSPTLYVRGHSHVVRGGCCGAQACIL